MSKFSVSASLDCQCVTLAVGFQLASVEIMAEIVVNLDPRIDTISSEKERVIEMSEKYAPH